MSGFMERVRDLLSPKREVILEVPEDQSEEERRQIRESLRRIQDEIEVISRQFGGEQ